MNEKTAFVFPGQGSQSVGMLGELAARYSVIEETYAEASKVLGYDLWCLVQKGPDEALNQTEHTQPAMLVGDVAVWRVWREGNGALPDWMAGHSLGEYAALVCAESIAFDDAVGVVAQRGRFMQEAVPQGQGAMVVIIGLKDEQVLKVCQEAAENAVLTAANYNAIGQTVLAGDADAAKRAVTLAEAAGARMAKLLPVSVPSHCALMRPAAERLAEQLEKITIQTPTIPVIQNADVLAHTEPAGIREALVKQLYSPVRWVETVQFFEAQGVKRLFECGPGQVLAGLNRRISRQLSTQSMNMPEKLEALLG